MKHSLSNVRWVWTRVVALAVGVGALLSPIGLQAREEHHDALRAAAFLMVRDIRDPVELPPEEELCTADMCQVCHRSATPDGTNFGTQFLAQLIGTGGWSFDDANDADSTERIELMLDAMETMASTDHDYYGPRNRQLRRLWPPRVHQSKYRGVSWRPEKALPRRPKVGLRVERGRLRVAARGVLDGAVEEAAVRCRTCIARSRIRHDTCFEECLDR